MKVYGCGAGNALYFAGSFDEAGGVVAHDVAQFCSPGVFQAGFESGDTDGWSQVLP